MILNVAIFIPVAIVETSLVMFFEDNKLEKQSQSHVIVNVCTQSFYGKIYICSYHNYKLSNSALNFSSFKVFKQLMWLQTQTRWEKGTLELCTVILTFYRTLRELHLSAAVMRLLIVQSFGRLPSSDYTEKEKY